jgi:transposase
LKPHAEVRAELQRRAKAPTSAHRDRFRANIILLRLEGLKIESVAKQLKTSMPTVSTWSGRFEAHGLDGLNDKAGRGRKPSIPRKKIERVVAEVTRPPKNRKRWSVRSMGRHAGLSHSTVQRIWSKNGLKPHVVRTFKLSNDPKFEEKFWDVIGLYLDPPAKALVLYCDEKSQALERTQLGLPLALKRPPHDDTRLHPAWHDHIVCRTRCNERQVDHAHRGAPHSCRMAEIPETDRPQNTQGTRRPSDPGQLCHS